MKNLLLSGETSQLSEWNIQEIIGVIKTREQQSIEMEQKMLDQKIGRFCGGMTYLEIEHFNNKYNNFK